MLPLIGINFATNTEDVPYRLPSRCKKYGGIINQSRAFSEKGPRNSFYNSPVSRARTNLEFCMKRNVESVAEVSKISPTIPNVSAYSDEVDHLEFQLKFKTLKPHHKQILDEKLLNEIRNLLKVSERLIWVDELKQWIAEEPPLIEYLQLAKSAKLFKNGVSPNFESMIKFFKTRKTDEGGKYEINLNHLTLKKKNFANPCTKTTSSKNRPAESTFNEQPQEDAKKTTEVSFETEQDEEMVMTTLDDKLYQHSEIETLNDEEIKSIPLGDIEDEYKEDNSMTNFSASKNQILVDSERGFKKSSSLLESVIANNAELESGSSTTNSFGDADVSSNTRNGEKEVIQLVDSSREFEYGKRNNSISVEDAISLPSSNQKSHLQSTRIRTSLVPGSENLLESSKNTRQVSDKIARRASVRGQIRQKFTHRMMFNFSSRKIDPTESRRNDTQRTDTESPDLDSIDDEQPKKEESIFSELPDLPEIFEKKEEAYEDYLDSRETERDKMAPLLAKQKPRWGKKKYDVTYAEDLEKDRLAEVRKLKMRKKLQLAVEKSKRRTSIYMPDGPRYETYGFLAKYCILKKLNVGLYRNTFDVCDENSKRWLTSDELMMALKGVNPNLKDYDIDHMNMVMKICGYDTKSGADFKLFSVLAALSVKLVTLDSWIRNSIGFSEFKMMQKKIHSCRKLWECLVDPETNTISANSLCVELKAGGVTNEHIQEVYQRLGKLGNLSLIDFLTYIPLFITLHESIINNPLDMTERI